MKEFNLKDLTQEIPYQWRKGPKGTTLAYVDARQVGQLLDEVVGPENWQDDYKSIDDTLFCGVGIQVSPDRWVWKWDAGTESKIAAEKGQVSDAFKRACVKWGIGRFLYFLDNDKGGNGHEYEKTSIKATKAQTDDLQSVCKKLSWTGKDLESYLKTQGTSWKTLSMTEAVNALTDLAGIANIDLNNLREPSEPEPAPIEPEPATV